MPRSGGTYTAPASSWNPAVPGTTLSSTDYNAQLADISTALTNSIATDGLTPIIARIPFAAGTSAAAGTVALASYASTGDLDTGMYFPTTNQAAVTAGGVQSALFTSTGVTVPGVVRLADGLLATPGIAFASDLDTGFYLISAGSIGVAAGGVLSATFTAAGLTFTGVTTGSLSVTDNATLGSSNADTLTVNAISTFADAVTFNGTVTFNGNPSFTGNLTIGNASSDTLTINSTATATALATFSAGANLTPAATPATNAVGYLGTPQNLRSGNYNVVMSDTGKDLYFTTTSITAIPANASIAFPIGSIVQFSVAAGQVLTITITTDTLRWVPANLTGSRTLTGPAFCTIQKKTATEWWISGAGLS